MLIKKNSKDPSREFSALLDHLFVMLDTNLRVVCFSNTVSSALKLPQSKILGRHFFRLIAQWNIPFPVSFEELQSKPTHDKDIDCWHAPNGDRYHFTLRKKKVLDTDYIIFSGKRLDYLLEDFCEHDWSLDYQCADAALADFLGIAPQENRGLPEDLNHANQIKNQFIRNMEHDLRTPFNGIYSTSAYLISIEQDPEKKELLQGIYESAKELLDFCNRILAFSEQSVANDPKMMEQFSLSAQLKTIAKMMTIAAVDKSLRFDIHMDSQIPEVLVGDANRLLRVLMNIVGNAIKFTHQGGVTVHAKLRQWMDDDHVLIGIDVIDTGIGIPSEKRPFIFEHFSRLEGANKGLNRGLGLGLGIAKQLMEDMGGTLTFVSAEDEGTIFTCVFPLKVSKEAD